MIILWIFLALLACYALFVLAPSLLFYRIIFSGRRAATENNAGDDPLLAQADTFLHNHPHRPLSMKSRDGFELRGVFYDAGSRKTAVFLHGYNTPPERCLGEQAAFLFRRGFNAAYIYQRAHCGSGGVSTLGCKEQFDLEDWIAAIRAQTGTDLILVYGISMGSTTAAYASDKLDGSIVRGMVLDCGFTSPYSQLEWEMRRRFLPVPLIGPLLTFFARRFAGVDIKASAAQTLSRSSIPTLFMHGGADLTVPAEQGRNNYDACASPKRWFSVPEAPHKLCFRAGGRDAEKALLDFVDTYFE